MITANAQLLKRAPSWLYKIGAQSWIDREYPRHLFIETTAACNLSCDYCPREKIKDHMDFGLFKSIIDEATSHGPRSFSFHLFGEPFLYPSFFEAVAYTKAANKKHAIIITSNGTMFNKYIDEIVISGIDKLIWSWRPEAKFTEDTKERLRRWGKLTVRMIDGQIPQEALEEWREWPSLESRPLHNYGGNIQLENFGVQPTIGKRWTCYHLWFAPAVSWNGDLLICCSDPHKKEVLGRFPEMTVGQAWKQMSKVRAAHLRGEYSGICATCDVWKSYPDIWFPWQKS